MGLRWILILTLLSSTVYAESWRCKNDMEIRCADGKCSEAAKHALTPMSVNFSSTGEMSVCAYSGCWQGKGIVNRTKSFLSVTGHGLKFSTAPNNPKMREDILIALDRRDNVAVLKVGGFAHPLICKSKQPTFADYKAKVFTGTTKQIRFRRNRSARMFRTRLRQARKGGVNFAGHFIYADWGCGTSCVMGAIINARTGAVYFPKEFAGIGFGIGEVPVSDEPLGYRKNSRLFILKGYAANSKKGAGTTYLVWEGTRFKQVGFDPIKDQDKNN